jgi:ubiquitin-conjugating enzyme E2 D/E
MAQAQRAIGAHLAEFKKNPPPGSAGGPIKEADVFHWLVTIQGPPGSPYEGGIFKVTIDFPQEFPRKAPTVKMTTKIWHPAFSVQKGSEGEFCDEILTKWVVTQKTVNVIKKLVDFLKNPEASAAHAGNPAPLEELLGDKAKFNETATQWTRQYAV